jgi:hypothetical protein
MTGPIKAFGVKTILLQTANLIRYKTAVANDTQIAVDCPVRGRIQILIAGIFSANHPLKLLLTPMEIFLDWVHYPSPHIIAVKAADSFCKETRVSRKRMLILSLLVKLKPNGLFFDAA